MKLASLRQGGRDGTPIVVNRALAHAVAAPDIAPTLQRALEQWATLAPRLAVAHTELETGQRHDAFAFDAAACASPLPRSYQFLDGSVYLHHMEKARRARSVEMPPNHLTEPLMYQGVSDGFYGPRESLQWPDEALELDYEAEVAIVVDDVPMGINAAEAGSHILLVMLFNDVTARALTRSELPKGFGFLHSKPTSAFSPVAVTPDELGTAWDGTKLSLPLLSWVNDRHMGHPNAGADMFFTYPELIAHAARTRKLGAGTIIGAGAVSNCDETTGFGCIAEARVHEQYQHGAATTPFLRFGDSVRIDMLDGAGRSIFGAVEQHIRTGCGPQGAAQQP